MTLCVIFLGNKDSSEDSNLDSSGILSSGDASEADVSLYVPTPERRSKKKLSRVVSQKMAFMDLSQLDRFMTTVNRVRGCNTPSCKAVQVLSTGLGGALSITYICDGCQLQRAEFKTSSVCKLINTSEISVCVQTAFIIAGCTHATYCSML